jgi:hypothetical protein
VRHDPLDWSTFKSHRAAGHKKVFNHFRNFITAVSEQSVPPHADTKTSTHPVKNDRGNYSRPAPEKESCDGSQMRNNEKNASAPVNLRSSRRYGFSVILRCQSKLPRTTLKSQNVTLSKHTGRENTAVCTEELQNCDTSD